ncbi:MAG TPA: hypothetical protein VII06_08810 [Chloroflexota bacterium]|jgi:hypothetical protein
MLVGQKSAAIWQVWALVRESVENGGDDAEPISHRAAELAADFIRALPDDVPPPELAWEPDGAISLDWIQARDRVVSVSIGESDRLPYAWLDDADRGHAVAAFDRQAVLPRILEGIRGIVQRGNAAIGPA